MLPARNRTVLFPTDPVLSHHPMNPPAAFLMLRCDTAPSICLQLGRKTKRLRLMMSKGEGVDGRAKTTIFQQFANLRLTTLTVYSGRCDGRARFLRRLP